MPAAFDSLAKAAFHRTQAAPPAATPLVAGGGFIAARRRAEFDWLRVLALGMLMVFHSAIGFSSWTWHVSDSHQSDLLDAFLDFLLRWRVALVFIVSGAALMLALDSRSPAALLRERGLRLGLPLIFGMLVVVPPQVYLEQAQRGTFQGSYIDFLPHLADGIYPLGNLSWHHLWFIPYVLVLSAVSLPLLRWVHSRDGRRRLDRTMRLAADRHLYWLLVAPLALAQALLLVQESDTHSFLYDGRGWLSFGLLFLLGAALAVWPRLLAAIQHERYVALIVGIVAYAALRSAWPNIGENPAALPLQSALGWCALSALNLLAWTLAVVGFLTKHFTRGSALLTYASEAALPVYILHQTLIVFAVYQLRGVDGPLAAKIVLTLAFALVISLALYEFVIRRNYWLGLMFGAKPRAARGSAVDLIGGSGIVRPTSRWTAPSSSNRRPS